MRFELFLPDLAGGGAERSLLAVARGLAAKDEMRVVLARAAGAYLERARADLLVDDLGAGKTFAAIPALARRWRANPPDGTLSGLEHANVVHLLAARLSRRPFRRVVSIRNQPSEIYRTGGRVDRAAQRLARRLYPGADAVVCVSEGVREDTIRFYGLDPAQVQTVYNPVIDAAFRREVEEPAEHPYLRIPGGPVAVGAGRLNRQKDFGTLLRAVAQVPGLRLIILGEGPERESLEAERARLEITDRVDLPGFLANPFPTFRAADLFVLSSRFEGLPGVLVQAMAAGTRLVSTDCPSGPREILEDGRWGRLVPVGDADALARAMVESLRDAKPLYPEITLSRFIEKQVVSRYRHLLTGVD